MIRVRSECDGGSNSGRVEDEVFDVIPGNNGRCCNNSNTKTNR